MEYAHKRDDVQTSINMSAPQYPQYVMLHNNQGSLRPPPQRRNLPRYHSHDPQHLKSGGNCCLKCICCCYCFLLFLIIALTVLAYVLYATFKPHVPSYKIENFDVNAFHILPDLSLNAEFSVTVKANNNNDHIGFKYGKDSKVAVNYTGRTLCSGKLPAFSQPPNNISMIKVDLRGKTEFGSGLQESLMKDRNSGKVPLLIMVKAPIVVVLGSFPLREVIVRINCSLVVDNLATDKKIGILSTKYDYELIL